MKRITSFLMVAVFLAAGCSSLDKSEAEAIATDFVRSNVMFYSKDQQANSTETIPQYEIGSVSSYSEGKEWVVVVHISAEVDGEVKDNDITVNIDRSGKITKFNGKTIPTN